MICTSFERPDASIQVSADADAVRESGRRRGQTQGTLFLMMVSADKMTGDKLIDNVSVFL